MNSIFKITSLDKLKKQDGDLFDSLTRNNISAVKKALDAGADINAKDGFGYTPLYKAAMHGNKEFIKLLAEAGANINNLVLPRGKAPLHAAVQSKRTEAVKLLISLGADVNIRDKDGYSPLHYAVMEDKVECVELLLDSGADIEIKNNSGNTALLLAVKKGSVFCIQPLLKTGADFTEIDADGMTAAHLAAEIGCTSIMSALAEAGADMDARDESGRTPMEILKHCYSGEYDRCADMIRKITKKVSAERLENEDIKTLSGTGYEFDI